MTSAKYNFPCYLIACNTPALSLLRYYFSTQHIPGLVKPQLTLLYITYFTTFELLKVQLSGCTMVPAVAQLGQNDSACRQCRASI